MAPVLTKKCIYVVKTGAIRKFRLKGIAATTIMPALYALVIACPTIPIIAFSCISPADFCTFPFNFLAAFTQ